MGEGKVDFCCKRQPPVGSDCGRGRLLHAGNDCFLLEGSDSCKNLLPSVGKDCFLEERIASHKKGLSPAGRYGLLREGGLPIEVVSR
jgi:hypothetical protein